MHFTTRVEDLNNYFQQFVDFAGVREATLNELTRNGTWITNWRFDDLNDLSTGYTIINEVDYSTPENKHVVSDIYAEKENQTELNDFLKEFKIVK